MGFDESDPTARRRWEPEGQRERDAEILRLYHAKVSQRDIAKRLGCSLGTVQYIIRREKRAQQLPDALGEPGNVPTVISDEGLCAEDVADRPELWFKCNPLERYRLLHHQPQVLGLVAAGHRLPPIHDDDHAACCVAHGVDPDWTPDSYDTVSHPWPPDEPDDW